MKKKEIRAMARFLGWEVDGRTFKVPIEVFRRVERDASSAGDAFGVRMKSPLVEAIRDAGAPPRPVPFEEVGPYLFAAVRALAESRDYAREDREQAQAESRKARAERDTLRSAIIDYTRARIDLDHAMLNTPEDE